MLLFISCYRYSSSARAWRMCVHKRMVSWGHSLISFFPFPPSPRNHRGDPSKGGGEAGRHGGRQAAEVQIRRSYTLVLRLAQGWIAGQQAGLHAAVALVTHSNEASVSTGTSQVSLLSFHPHSGFLPSLFHGLFFSSISSFHFATFLNKT